MHGREGEVHQKYALERDSQDAGALEFAPGSHWLYSDFGFGLLGTLMADKIIPGQEKPPFAAAVAREITDPLGMMGTVIETKATDLAVPYYLDGTRAPLWNNTGAIAGGGGLGQHPPRTCRFGLQQLSATETTRSNQS